MKIIYYKNTLHLWFLILKECFSLNWGIVYFVRIKDKKIWNFLKS